MSGDKPFGIGDTFRGSIFLAVQNVFSTAVGVFGYAFLTRAITKADMGIVASLPILSAENIPMFLQGGKDRSRNSLRESVTVTPPYQSQG
jgi:hypothetical protein